MNYVLKFDFDDNERSIIISSLNYLRTSLTKEDRPVDFIDDIIIQLDGNKKVELNLFDSKIVINALNKFRINLKSLNKHRTDVNNVLIKVMDEADKKVLTKKRKRGNRDR